MKNKLKLLPIYDNYFSFLNETYINIGEINYSEIPYTIPYTLKAYYIILSQNKKEIIILFSALSVNKKLKPNNLDLEWIKLEELKYKKKELGIWNNLCVIKLNKKLYKTCIKKQKNNIYKDFGTEKQIKQNIIKILQKKNIKLKYIYQIEDIWWFYQQLK